LRGLVLLAPSPPTPEPITDADRAHLLASWGDRDAMTAIVEKISVRPLSVSGKDGLVDDMLLASKSAWEAWLKHGSREDISGSLHEVAVPIDLVVGDGDRTIPAAMLRRELLERAPDAVMESVAGAGHLLPIEAAEEVAAIIRARQFPPIAGTPGPTLPFARQLEEPLPWKTIPISR
jgi:pimeloyl-ACP methyl ester carboxylesterase